jgi:thymidylate kinase
MKDKKLIVIEGFDRSGKDTLLQDLKNYIKDNSIYIYENDLTGLPSYSKEQGKFLDWLNLFIDKQTNELNKLFETYDTVIMVRLIVSDEVYSHEFNRERTTIKYMNKLDGIEINNYCILFKNFSEYSKRINRLGFDLQYQKQEFEDINKLYSDILDNIGYKYHINYIKNWTTPEEILSDFINIYELDNVR